MTTRRKPVDPDAITLATAADMLGLSQLRVTRLRREGLLTTLGGWPSYSRRDVQQFIDDPWLNGRQAAIILGVSHARVSQLAAAERIPVHLTVSGQRVYRQRQLETVAHARAVRAHPDLLLKTEGSGAAGGRERADVGIEVAGTNARADESLRRSP